MLKEVAINKNTSGQFYTVNLSANRGAMKNLTKSGYFLYSYLLQNKNEFVLTLRRTHVMEVTGLSKSSYYDALSDLIAHKYLVDCGDGYEFYESPLDNM